MKALVCGGRQYSNYHHVCEVLDSFTDPRGRTITLVIHGAAPGADSLAAQWADTRNIPTLAFPADWRAHGRAAGAIRNARMLAEGRPDVVIAFPGGRGTADMMIKARRAGCVRGASKVGKR